MEVGFPGVVHFSDEYAFFSVLFVPSDYMLRMIGGEPLRRCQRDKIRVGICLRGLIHDFDSQ